jgi:hypothetical protein
MVLGTRAVRGTARAAGAGGALGDVPTSTFSSANHGEADLVDFAFTLGFIG